MTALFKEGFEGWTKGGHTFCVWVGMVRPRASDGFLEPVDSEELVVVLTLGEHSQG